MIRRPGMSEKALAIVAMEVFEADTQLDFPEDALEKNLLESEAICFIVSQGVKPLSVLHPESWAS